MVGLHVVNPLQEHTHTVILLHGRGSPAAEFAPEFFESQWADDRNLPELFPTIKWVFPTSELRFCEGIDDSLISQWFDMSAPRNPQQEKERQKDGLRDSVPLIAQVIRKEVDQLSPEKVILGGISQGSAIAFHALLFAGIPLGGVIGLSTWLPFQEEVYTAAATGAKHHSPMSDIVPMAGLRWLLTRHEHTLGRDYEVSKCVFISTVFLSHSEDDDVVPWSNGFAMCQI